MKPKGIKISIFTLTFQRMLGVTSQRMLITMLGLRFINIKLFFPVHHIIQQTFPYITS